MVRKAMRSKAVKAALGDLPNSTFYDYIARGVIPRGKKLDPDGRTVIWWQDEIEAVQEAIERQDAPRHAQADEAAA
jgi:predicted DNA-binding transcriptional regulator AlpA